ncbi:hypothetical protein G7092_07965 [Mucilaginibacter sp. HC2]|uniref:hypothetical protein n=1 Tax=Mucilaginibacter inviolabilis TaxID=2714892 RepID=UPI001407FE4E|nr:hypothetical protein [Mucilaginibacter inviolabilis]NHA03725.1 hypothetical protein [Mucilaginibacter inviolabilis]
MKKNIIMTFVMLLTLTMFSCTKKADIEGIEPKLPPLQLSSLGYQQVSPFTISNTVLQLNFGATTTNMTTGAFKVDILNGSTVIKTVNFAAWTGKDESSTGTTTNHTIDYTLQSTTYSSNTSVYAGTINLKLSLLGLTNGGTYGVRATAYNADKSKSSSITQASFFKTTAQ